MSVLTRIRSPASSSDSVFASEVTPDRKTFDSARFGIGSFTEDDVPIRIAPPPRCRIDGTTQRTARTTLMSSRSNALCHATSSKLSESPAGGPPVFANSASTAPSLEIVSVCQRAMASALLRSAVTGNTRAPVIRAIDSAACSMPRVSRDAIDTEAPSAASACATA
jgi:hypothetical protein